LSFIEVLQFDLPYYEVWYDVLNLGMRIAPAAGTDFPCIPSIPGRERFYTRVDGRPDRAAWVRGVRSGRIFVTNGPLLDFTIDEVGIGGDVRLESPRTVHIRGRARFDAARDNVQRLELVRNGEIVAVAESSAAEEISLDVTAGVEQPAWFALRAVGEKVGETPMDTPWYLTPRSLRLGCRIGCGASMFERAEFVGAGRQRPAAAHTAPIYVTVAGRQASPPAELVRRTLERLDDLEARLSDERLDELVVFRPFAGLLLIDGVPAPALRRDRPALRALIESARQRYRALSQSRDRG
jgi:hypothetical protein